MMRCEMGKADCLLYVHNADVHILIGALLQEDLLAGATFLGCAGEEVWARRRVEIKIKAREHV